MAITKRDTDISKIENTTRRSINSDIKEILIIEKDFIISSREAGKSDAKIAEYLQKTYSADIKDITKEDNITYPDNTWTKDKETGKSKVTKTVIKQFIGKPTITASHISKVK
ncbi:hypothetical protein [Sulfurimonas sp.]|uniref:hypothetical protein n=1 Tax=Sulfurimonas sp. TaxID=2022749 RepID=UPI002B45DAC1|nr:hypothetical protein [Sulfurimonas sp.]